MDDINDDMLLEAIRRRARIMRELQHEMGSQQGGGSSSITNNVYGGQLGGGVAEQLGDTSEMTPEERDYFVKIARRNVTDDEGNVIGWDKDVHRYTQPHIPPASFKKKAP